ncbi:protein of unknown function [Pseudodesulfovibrio profundus]|uniref:Uncharacterized protein n=1 Tax=Pseudodesulfovibrio profundus TaxID=57320 RepID=A0A2C8FE55_9BACT|nr:protein of unknown function [Pseudodesulfovibrio profundus]
MADIKVVVRQTAFDAGRLHHGPKQGAVLNRINIHLDGYCRVIQGVSGIKIGNHAKDEQVGSSTLGMLQGRAQTTVWGAGLEFLHWKEALLCPDIMKDLCKCVGQVAMVAVFLLYEKWLEVGRQWTVLLILGMNGNL